MWSVTFVIHSEKSNTLCRQKWQRVFLSETEGMEDEKAVDSFGDGIPVGVAAIPFPDTHSVHAERDYFRLGIEILYLDRYALALMAAGYGIGRSFTHDTLVQMSQHVAGVFGASFVAIGISLLVSWFTYKHTFANLLSCIMGMLPGGLNQMMLMADEDPRADANVVVMQQTIRLFGVVISVPFLVIHLLGASVVPQGLLVPVGDNTGLTWLLMIPVAGIGSDFRHGGIFHYLCCEPAKASSHPYESGPVEYRSLYGMYAGQGTAAPDTGTVALRHHRNTADHRREHRGGGDTGPLLRDSHCYSVSGHGSRRHDGDVSGGHEHGGRCVHYPDVPDCAPPDDEPDGAVHPPQVF